MKPIPDLDHPHGAARVLHSAQICVQPTGTGRHRLKFARSEVSELIRVRVAFVNRLKTTISNMSDVDVWLQMNRAWSSALVRRGYALIILRALLNRLCTSVFCAGVSGLPYGGMAAPSRGFAESLSTKLLEGDAGCTRTALGFKKLFRLTRSVYALAVLKSKPGI